ncbi:unnamed protein product, partial [Tetraodon nigroviridis]
TQLELWEVNHVLNVSPRIRPWPGCWDTGSPDLSLALARRWVVIRHPQWLA